MLIEMNIDKSSLTRKTGQITNSKTYRLIKLSLLSIKIILQCRLSKILHS